MLTTQQIQEARSKLGTTQPVGQATGSSLLAQLQGKPKETLGQDLKSDYLGIGKDIIAGSQKRAENINEIKTKMQTGTKGNIPAILETAGQLAGAGSDAIGSVFKGAIKMALTPKTEQKVKELVSNFGQKVVQKPEVQKVISWYDKLPEDKKDALDAVGGFASLAGDFVGMEAGTKAVKTGAGAVKEGAAQVAKRTGDIATGAKKIAGEVVPSAERVVNYQVTKALDLTAGDVKNINLSTGNEVGQFLADKNLIKGNKVETEKAIKEFYDNQYKTVRDEIGKVTNTYDANSVPRYKQALQEIQKQVGSTTGLEDATNEIKTLLKKETISLNDVQRAKELLDEHFNLYKVTGDVKEGVTKQGLSNLRTDLKEFIENEVKNNTGADIKALNNDVSTSRSTLNAIEERSTRGLTSSNIKIGDLGVFGVGSALGSPLVGVAAVIGKKILESSAIRLKIARYLDSISDARKLKIKETLINGQVPTEIKKIVEGQSNLTPKAINKKMVTQKVSIPKKK